MKGFKELTEEEVNNLSDEDFRSYMINKAVFEWTIKSFVEKDRDILSWQEFYINRRGIEGMNLEESLDIVLDLSKDMEAFHFSSVLKYRRQAYKEIKENGECFTFFWATRSPFSQWHKSNFIGTTCLIEGINDFPELKRKHILQDLFPLDFQLYSSAEQFMMYHKAIIFLDREIAKIIMQTSDVKKIKELGRKIKNYDENVWKYYRSKVVYEGNKAKFLQNEELKNALIATKGSTLVEAAPNDKIWGIGMDENNSKALKRETWEGKNLLGEILTHIRVEILELY